MSDRALASPQGTNEERLFSFDAVYRHPGKFSKLDYTGARKKIAIIGGGVAGLTAAWEVSKLGHTVTIYEAEERLGGRILTHHFDNENYGEFGAMRIPANHHCTIHYINEFGLQKRAFVNFNPNAYLFLRGVKTRIKDWKALFRHFSLRENEQKDPFLLYEEKMKIAMAQLTTEEKWAMFSNKLPEGKLTAFDEMSLYQFLTNWFSQDAIQFVGHSTSMYAYEQASFLETLIDYFGVFRVDQFELVGGMETLIAAFRSKMEEKIRTNSEVVAVKINESKVILTIRHNEEYSRETFDYVICAVPAPRVTKISFTPPLSPEQYQAFRGINYASSAKTLCLFKNRFWETKDKIFGGGSFTDLPIQQVWYPSDNSKPSKEKDFAAGFTGSDDRDRFYSKAPKSFEPIDKNTTTKPGVVTGAYTWEGNARRFIALSQREKDDLVISNLEMIHPGASKYLTEVKHYCWDESSNPGRGAFAFFSPSDHQRYQQGLTMPYPSNKPLLFFAGEHIAIAHAWIQGAIQSALSATISVLKLARGEKPVDASLILKEFAEVEA